MSESTLDPGRAGVSVTPASRAGQEPEAASAKPGGYVAVVLCHGMGSQRHYEDLSRLVDRLDRATYELSHREDAPYRGVRLADRSAHVELPRDGSEASKGRDVVYIRAVARDPRGGGITRVVRFYEAYWAPETVDGTNAGAVAVWLARQIHKPIEILAGSWRSFQRLRRGSLIALYQARRARPGEDADVLRRRTARLIQIYEAFQAPAQRVEFPSGSYDEFERHLEKSLHPGSLSEEDRAAIRELARDWRRDHERREWFHLFAMVTLSAGGVGFLGLIGILAWRLLGVLPQWFAGNPSLRALLPTPGFGSVTTVAGAALAVLGVQKFLRDAVGDVQQYVAYEETDHLYQRRRAVLDSTMRQLRHVLADDACERVVVVAHSLGTAVAVDAMLGLWRANRASGAADPMKGPVRLDRIQHLVTYGSPIDKINYFFSVIQSSSGTYERLVEDLRGDIGTPPFSKVGRQPHVHWINYWDKGDIISGPIETVANEHLRGQEVDNVRVVNHVLPDLAGSHGGYLDLPRVAKDLVDVVLFDRHSFVHLDPPPEGEKAPRRSWLGPGRGSRAQSIAFALVLLIPWLLLGASIELIVRRPVGFGAALLVAAIAYLATMASHGLARWGRPLGFGLDRPAPAPSAVAAPPRPRFALSAATTRSIGVVLRMIGLIVLPAAIALLSVRVPPPGAWAPGTDPSPLGYTLSLSIFLIPGAVLGLWFTSHRRGRDAWLPLILALAWTTGTGFVLDLFFARSFFSFPNPSATLGLLLPGYAPGSGWTLSLPIEEFVFYLSGFAAILLLYIWADAEWLRRDRPIPMSERAAATRRLLGLHFGTLWTALLLAGGAFAFKKLVPGVDHEGFPGYLTFLLVVAAAPSLALFGVARDLVNWRAFSLTLVLLLLVSLLWEVTLAIPYGWWGYQRAQMLGLFVTAWGRIPIEALLVWVAASWGAVIMYEAARLFVHMRRSWRHAMFGAPHDDPDAPPAGRAPGPAPAAATREAP